MVAKKEKNAESFKDKKMKIISAKLPKSKAAEIREICSKICNKDEAIYADSVQENKYIYKVAKQYGYNVKSRCSEAGGFEIWIFKNIS